MYKGRTKKIRDTIHGYIEIPEIIANNIIDTEQFQRLRYIEQTSMRPLYPAARHDRFIHSLGVYWLGVQAFDYFRKNAQRVLENSNLDQLDDKWWTKQGILFSLACLLHDCAHAPFSHTLEDMYGLRKETLGKKNPYRIRNKTQIMELDLQLMEKCGADSNFQTDFLREGENSLEKIGVGAPHEKLSSYCVMSEYQDVIKTLCKQMLQEENLDADNISDEDIVFIVRMIIGCPYRERGIEKSIKNCLISMLNSSSIDVDGLDYIVRDAYMSGIDNFSIDYQRLLSSFTLITVEVFRGKRIDEKNIDEIWLKGSRFEVGKLNADEISGYLTIESKDKFEDSVIQGINCTVKNGGKVCEVQGDEKIRVNDLRKARISMKESCKIRGGNFSGKIIEGKRIVSSLHPPIFDDSEFEFILGYDKNSLSIIQSTVEARNHEYLWVYTHPKVLYSSNYLQVELLRNSAKYLCCCAYNDQFSNEKLMFDCKKCKKRPDLGVEEDLLLYVMGYATYFNGNVKHGLDNKCYQTLIDKGFRFYRTCDDDINALFKRIYIENKERGDKRSEKLHCDFEEFFSRNHRRPLWKSFIEYDNFLKMCGENVHAAQVIPRLCKSAVNKESIYKDKYAEPTEKQQAIFRKHGFENVLIIKSSVKTKELNPYETFIKFKDQSLRLCDIFDRKTLKGKMSKDFYYIFANYEKEISNQEMLQMVLELGKEID